MCHVRTDIHQVRDALTALALSIALEQLAHLEEQHDEDGLRELCLGTWQEADAQGTDGGYRHQQVLVHGFTMHQAFHSFLQRIIAY